MSSGGEGTTALERARARRAQKAARKSELNQTDFGGGDRDRDNNSASDYEDENTVKRGMDARIRLAKAKAMREAAKKQKENLIGEINENEGIDTETDEVASKFLEPSLLSVEHAQPMFPLEIRRRSTNEERVVQPVMAVPPALGDDIDMTYNGFVQIMTCSGPEAQPDELKEHYDERIPRKEVFGGVYNRLQVNANNQNDTNREKEIERLLKVEEGDNNEYSEVEDIRGSYFDGVQLKQTPPMLQLYLTGESSSDVINGNNNARLSRLTQRLLRELYMVTDDIKLRKHVFDRNNNDEQAPGVTSLLRSSQLGNIVHVETDPATQSLNMLAMPESSESVGGVLGNWSEEDRKDEGLGPHILLDGADHKSNLKALDIRINGVLINDHPLFLDEERIYAKLKTLHSQYSLLFEHRATIYLSYRLYAAILELKKAVEILETCEPEDFTFTYDEYSHTLSASYEEIIQVLPALHDVKKTMDTLGSSIYTTWKELKAARTKQTFTCTRGQISVRRMVLSKFGALSPSNDKTNNMNAMPDLNRNISADEDTNPAFSRLDDDYELWNKLSGELSKLSSLLDGARTLISRSVELKTQASMSDLEVDTAIMSPSLATSKSQSKIKALKKEMDSAGARAESVTAMAVECCAGLAKGLIPEVVLSLKEESDITPDSALPAYEMARRDALTKVRIAVGLKAGGRIIARTSYKGILMPEQTADIVHTFSLKVVEEPMLSLNILMDNTMMGWSSLSGGEILTSLHCPIPATEQAVTNNFGATPTFAHTPIVEWLNFCSAKEYDFSDSIQTGVMGLLSSVMSTMGVGENTGAVTTNSSSRQASRIEGAVLMIAEYRVTADGNVNPDGFPHGELARLPLDAIRTQDVSKYDFARERDFQQMIRTKNNIDDQDPRNIALVQSKGRSKITGTRDERDVFQLQPGPGLSHALVENGTTYLNFTRLQEPLRSKLLKMRNLKPYLFTDPIPINERTIHRSDIYRSILQQERNKMDTPHVQETLINEDEEPESYDVKSSTSKAAASFWSRVRESQSNMARMGNQKNFSTSTVVAETDITPHLTWTQILNFSWLIPPRKRALRPTQAIRAPHVVQVQECHVLLQVVSARNLPNRNTDDDTAKLLDAEGASALRGFDQGSMFSCVEVKFQGNTVSTSDRPGTSPLWKQSLSLPFAAPQLDFSPMALTQIKDEVIFSVFDIAHESDEGRGGFMEGENTQRTEKRFLGSFSVPFSTIYKEGKIEGVFRLQTPDFNFGYDFSVNPEDETDQLYPELAGEYKGEIQRKTKDDPENGILKSFGLPSLQEMEAALTDGSQSLLNQASSDAGILFSDNIENELSTMVCGKNETYIKIMATLDPLLVTNNTQSDCLTVSSLYKEDRQYSAYAQNWLKNIRSHRTYTEDRSFQIVGTNSRGESVLIPRYLTAQQPPMGFTTRRECIHFVAQLPFIEDAHAFAGDKDVWCTTREAFDLCAGDEEEHAIMLFNFLYYLSLDVKRNTGGMLYDAMFYDAMFYD